MRTAQVITQRDREEEAIRAWLQAKPTEELRQFLTSPWVASLVSPETIEELYQELQQKEYIVEVGLD